MWPFALAMCNRLLPVSGSIAEDRIVEGVVERVLARWSMVEVRSGVEPRRAR